MPAPFVKGTPNDGPSNNKIFWDENKQLYVYSNPVYYQDISMVKVDRLLKNKWRFENSEQANMKQAESIFAQTGNIKNPFLNQLPNPSFYRHKYKTFVIKMMEKTHKIGFHPFDMMSDADNRAFVNRAAGVLPFAGEFLSLSGGVQIKQPWKYNISKMSKPLEWLHSAETKLRRLF